MGPLRNCRCEVDRTTRISMSWSLLHRQIHLRDDDTHMKYTWFFKCHTSDINLLDSF